MTALYNEHDAHAAQWLRNLIAAGMIAPGEVDERSIEDVMPSDLDGFVQCHFFAGIGVWSYALRRAGWPDDRPVWTASFPCQPFSAAGKGDGFADERHLWPFGHHLIRVCRPPIIFGEQVASKDGLAWLDLVQADMEGTGYALGALDLCAAGFGAPHIRQREYWVAKRLADADRKRRIIDPLLREGQEADLEAAGLGIADRVADAESFGRAGRQNDGDGGRRQLTSGQGCSLGGVDYAASARFDGQIEKPEGFARDETRLRVPGAGRGYDAERPGPTNGFWRASDWLGCTDGKWRPVEPGTQPLVDGASFGLGSGSAFEGRSRAKMLKGYGNAINAEQAAEFIRAAMEVMP